MIQVSRADSCLLVEGMANDMSVLSVNFAIDYCSRSMKYDVKFSRYAQNEVDSLHVFFHSFSFFDTLPSHLRKID